METHSDSSTSQIINSGTPTIQLLDSGVAVLYLGGAEERFVSLSFSRMASLRILLEQFGSTKPRGLIITSARPEMFCVGADIDAIYSLNDPEDGAKAAKEGQYIFDLIESLNCVTIAAISGPCVGGGCELALACNYRLLSDNKASQIGLPETKLGIIPGFGGTQRLPRLIGLPKALDIILSGKIVRPAKALSVGLVDEICPYHQLVERSEQIILGKRKAPKRSISFVDKILTFTSLGRRLVKSQTEKALHRTTKGFYPAPPAALNSCLYGLSKGAKAGYEYEARELGRVVCTSESKSLVHLYLLTEASKEIGKGAKNHVEHAHALVIGAGIMGAGIAASLAKSECNVILKDTSEVALKKGLDYINAQIEKLRYLSASEKSFVLNRIESTTRDSTNFGNVTIVVEAIIEDLDIKRAVLSDIAAQTPDEAIIASNTSSLSISKMAEGIKNPERVVGMHFFNPVDKMPLIEIVMGEKTSARTISLVSALTTKLGKFPIVVKDVPGFLVNRTLTPYLNEAAYLLEEGYSPRDIDKAATAFGLPMGPIRLLDEVGLDVATHVSKIMLDGYGARMAAPEFASKLASLGRLGKKNNKGFYDYNGKEVSAYAELSSVLGIKNKKERADLDHLQARLIMALLNEGVRCLDEGVAGEPGPDAAKQVDLGTVMGMGFPPFRGGLLYFANTIGAKKILEIMQDLESEVGPRFKACEGILRRASSGSSFLK